MIVAAMTPGILELKTYVPAKDFDESKRFYAELGFTLTEAWGGNVDCKLGGAQFRLQNYYNKDWAENFMMRFWVESVQEWYDFAKPIIDSGRYKSVRISEPELVGGDTWITHIWDPCGVLLIFIQ